MHAYIHTHTYTHSLNHTLSLSLSCALCFSPENMADPFQLWQAGENFLKLQKLGEKRPTLRRAEYPHLSKSNSIPCKMPALFGIGGKQKSMPTTLCVRPDAASPAHSGLELSMSTQSLKNLFKNVRASLDEVHDDHDFTNDASRTHPKLSPINPLPSAAKRLLPSTAHLAPNACKRVPVTSSGVQVGAPVPSKVEEPGGERGKRGEEGGGESRSTGHLLQWSPHSMSDPLLSESASPDKNPPHQNGLFGGALDAYPPNIPEILMSTTQPCNPLESALLDSLRVQSGGGGEGGGWGRQRRRSSIFSPVSQKRRLSLKLCKLVTMGLLEGETKINMVFAPFSPCGGDLQD